VIEARNHALHFHADADVARDAKHELAEDQSSGDAEIVRPRSAEVEIDSTSATAEPNHVSICVGQVTRREIGCANVELHLAHPNAIRLGEKQRSFRGAELESERLEC